jgi:hypothetical protein
MARVIARIAILALLLLPVAVFAEGVTILNVFPGDAGPGPKDAPDNTGAVGPKHVVDFTNAHVVIHDKRTGKVVQQWSQPEFWKAVKPGFDFPRLNDPRMLYDPLSGRWFGVIAEATGYLTVSDSSDPTKGWHGVKLPMQPCDVGMKLGVDRNGLYITYAILTGDTHTMHGCYAIPKADAIAAGGPSLAHLQTFTNLELDSFPATDLDPQQASRRAGDRPQPGVRQQLLQALPLPDHLGGNYRKYLEGADDPAEPDVCLSQRIVAPQPGHSARSGGQAAL